MRIVATVTAASYQTSFSSGRTIPHVFKCEALNGDDAGEYVVKMRNSIETHGAGLLREILGNLLGHELGLITAEPAIIKIDPELADAITQQDVAAVVRNSPGLNYGSRNLTGGYTVWPVGKLLPLSMRIHAADIFVFDALVQNPDRRVGKPNLLWKDDQLVVIDHEMAFSFLLSIVPSTSPWLLNEQPYLSNHVFFSDLCHSDLELDRIAGAVDAIGNEFWEAAAAIIPESWKGSEFMRIRTHVEAVQQHLDTFMNEIRRVLQ